MSTFTKMLLVFSLLIAGTVAGMLALLGFVCGGLNPECLQFSMNNAAYAESSSQPVIIINQDSPINAYEGNGNLSDETPNPPETAVTPLPTATGGQSSPVFLDWCEKRFADTGEYPMTCEQRLSEAGRPTPAPTPTPDVICISGNCISRPPTPEVKK